MADNTNRALDKSQSSRDNPQPASTLLPGPIASLVSFATATSSLSLRFGGFLGHCAINASRLGALGGVELGRAVLEGILFRAGQDVVETSSGRMGRAAAEGLLEGSLSTLHSLLTQSSFLISTGFQIGTTGLSATLGLSSALLGAVDAILGDTETSKAIATLVVLVQREFSNPGTGTERVNLGDVLSGTIGFALLQRWAWQKTEEDQKEMGTVELVWDLVVVDHAEAFAEQSLHLVEGVSGHDKRPLSRRKSRPTSMVTDLDMEDGDESVAIDDNASMVSNMSSVWHSGAPGRISPEQAFRQQLSSQLKPGSTVRVAAQSVLRNTVAVEVTGDQPSAIDPPPGYTLSAVQNHETLPDGPRTFIFQSNKKRSRRGSFKVDSFYDESTLASLGSTSEYTLADQDDATSTLDKSSSNANFEPRQETQAPSAEADSHERTNEPAPSSIPRPIKANQACPRTPLPDRSIVQKSNTAVASPDNVASSRIVAPDGKRLSIRNTLRRGTSYRHLVDFWNGSGSRGNRKVPTNQGQAQSDPRFQWQLAESRSRPQSPSLSRIPVVNPSSRPRPSMEYQHSFDLESRPMSRSSWTGRSTHTRGASSIHTLRRSPSETSIVLHASSMQNDRDHAADMLNRTGRLYGQYPSAPFAQNVARFARFSVAAYGANFLRFTGATTDRALLEDLEDDVEHLSQHRSFSSYARLPSSTVLLSSFVDPEGGANMTGETDTGMPLIHYISLDHDSKAVVLTCRGTLGFEDVLTDMTCDYEDFQWRGKTYQVHKGMLASARRLITLHGNRLIATMRAALEEYQDYGLILCGHSLGGGVAAILAMLISQPNPSFESEYDDNPAYVTASPSAASAMPWDGTESAAGSRHAADVLARTLPQNRPIHVYAYGPAAAVSPALSRATRGLVTTIVNNADLVPYLSLGNLRDIQTVALAFKTDTRDAKGEVRRRVWEGLRKSFRDRTGLGAFDGFFAKEWHQAQNQRDQDDDQWPLAALKSLRVGMMAAKLVPPGEVFIVERNAVLQRLAFTNDGGLQEGPAASARSFKPASHIRLTHVRDVAARFSEIRFQGSMFLDHLPARYEKVLEALEKGIV